MLTIVTLIFLVNAAFAVIKVPTARLNSYKDMPVLGLGTWVTGRNYSGIEDAIKLAINEGYRHIDTAYSYRNEDRIGKALNDVFANTNVTRQELFITSKIPESHHARSKVVEAIKETLKGLNVTYLDLALIHWPMGYEAGKNCGDSVIPCKRNGTNETIYSNVDYVETWQGLEDAVNLKLVRSIGLSNFNHEQILRVIYNANIRPAVLQIESRPYFRNTKLINFAKAHNIVVTAYCPLGRGTVGNDLVDPEIKKIATDVGKTPAQVILKYNLQRRVIVIPKSFNSVHIQENINTLSKPWYLTRAQVAIIQNLTTHDRIVPTHNGETHQYYPFKLDY